MKIAATIFSFLILLGCKSENPEFQRLVDNFPNLEFPINFEGTGFPSGKEFFNKEIAQITNFEKMEAIGKYSINKTTFLIVYGSWILHDGDEYSEWEHEVFKLYLLAYEDGRFKDEFGLKGRPDIGDMQEPFMNDAVIEGDTIRTNNLWLEYDPSGDSTAITRVEPASVYYYNNGEFVWKPDY